MIVLNLARFSRPCDTSNKIYVDPIYQLRRVHCAYLNLIYRIIEKTVRTAYPTDCLSHFLTNEYRGILCQQLKKEFLK